MKRAAHIFIMSLSVLIMLTVTFIPHHHHGSVECLSMVQCTYNDRHTSHQADCNALANHTCIASQFLSLRAETVSNHTRNTHQYTFSVAFIGTNTSTVRTHAASTPWAYSISFHSPYSKDVHSLRAPPVAFFHC